MTPARLAPVPNQPKRRSPRNVRVPDELWEAAMTAAAGVGIKLAGVIRQALEEFVKDPRGWVDRHRKDPE